MTKPPTMPFLNPDSEIERVREQRAYRIEAREHRTKAVGHMALISSGAIVVSINAIGPLFQANGRIVGPAILFVAWCLLLLTTVAAAPYRMAVASHTEAVIDCLQSSGTDADADADKRRRAEATIRKRKIWGAVAWVGFLGGLIVLLVFVAANLYLVPSAAK